MTVSIPLNNVERHAAELVDLLVDAGPLTADQVCAALGWSKGRFTAALKHAREAVCPALGFAIPTATPARGWVYAVTADWADVEVGASFSIGQAEARLKGVLRDVQTVKDQLTRGSREWRRANFLNKHLTHILSTLEEIDG